MAETQKKQGRKWVSSQFTRSRMVLDEQFGEESIEVATFEGGVPVAVAKVSLGLTLNLGNYESARIDCGVDLPCYVEELPSATKQAFAMCEAHIKEQTKGFRK